MKLRLLTFWTLLLVFNSTSVLAIEASGTGSMIAGPLVRVWAEAYKTHTPTALINYKGSSPADGIKRLVNKEVDFSGIDMPLHIDELKKMP